MESRSDIASPIELVGLEPCWLHAVPSLGPSRRRGWVWQPGFRHLHPPPPNIGSYPGIDHDVVATADRPQRSTLRAFAADGRRQAARTSLAIRADETWGFPPILAGTSGRPSAIAHRAGQIFGTPPRSISEQRGCDSSARPPLVPCSPRPDGGVYVHAAAAHRRAT